MSSSKIIQCVAKRENLTDAQADFLEQVILAVRQDCQKANSSGAEAVISKLLDASVGGGEN